MLAGKWVIQVTDNGGGSRLYGPFDTEDAARAYVERRRGCSTAPRFYRRSDDNYVILQVVPAR